mgnify:CR=1 FL=1
MLDVEFLEEVTVDFIVAYIGGFILSIRNSVVSVSWPSLLLPLIIL